MQYKIHSFLGLCTPDLHTNLIQTSGVGTIIYTYKYAPQPPPPPPLTKGIDNNNIIAYICHELICLRVIYMDLLFLEVEGCCGCGGWRTLFLRWDCWVKKGYSLHLIYLRCSLQLFSTGAPSKLFGTSVLVYSTSVKLDILRTFTGLSVKVFSYKINGHTIIDS